MEYTSQAFEKSTVKVTLNFTGEEWKEALNKAYFQTRSKYNVPGFRKGKAPKSVIENFYGKGAFYDEALNNLFAEHYPQMLEKEKDNFTAVGDPMPSVDALSDEGVTITCVIPVKPEVTISAYTGLTIKQYNYTVTDEEVQAEVKKILVKGAEDKEVTDRPCQNDDTVNIDFSGSVDGVVFPGGTAEGYDLVLGSHSFIPGFEEQVCGMTLGEEKDITVTFPENYQNDELKGKEAVFAIKLNKITEKQLPELTDEYVKANTNVETVEAYTAQVRERLEKQAAKKSLDETENSIVNEICKNATVEIPQAMIETEIDRIVQDFSYRLMYQGLKLEDYLEYMGTDMATFRSQYSEQAKSRVLSQLVIEKIIKEQGFTAEQDEIDAKVAEQAESVGKTAEEYRKTMDPRQFEYIASDIVITKMFDYLKANNTLVD